MISMTKTRLGVLPRPVTGHVGSGAKSAFGGGAGMSWLQQPISQDQCAFVRMADPIPTAYNTTGVSAPPERSP